MKLKNKKTGKIIEAIIVDHGAEWEIRNMHTNEDAQTYDSLAELNEEWGDVPTEEVWYLGERIGNYSMPKKEARKTTEKILAWKRLKDKGFRFDGFYDKSKQHILWHCGLPYITDDEFYKDLDLIFGGEE